LNAYSEFRQSRNIQNHKEMLAFLLKFPVRKFTYIRYQRIIRTGQNLEDRFTRIWKTNIWGSLESRSGEGSTLRMTENIRAELPIIFEKFQIRSVFDGPCGDFNWMREVDLSRVDYIGADIVEPVIAILRNSFSKTNVNFLHHDLTRDPMPECDLILNRDCLFHFSYEDIFKYLVKFLESNSKYILTTSHKNSGEFRNRNIETGDFRLLDLFDYPFSFSREFLYKVEEPGTSKHAPRALYLWTRKQVEEVIFVLEKELANSGEAN
jgi:hypothetical protein